MQIPEAKPIPQIKATANGDNFSSVVVFTIEGNLGLYRRIKMTGNRLSMESPEPDVFRALLDGTLRDFKRWESLEAKLADVAGLECMEVNEEGEPEMES